MVKQKLLLVLLLALFATSLLSFIPEVKAVSWYTTKILESGEDAIHGSTFYDGYVWFSTQTDPAKIIKMNRNTMSYSVITLDSGLNYGRDMKEAGGSIWVPISVMTTYLIKVNASTMAWEYAINFTAGEIQYGQSLTYTDDDYLWIGGQNGKLARVNITDLTYDIYDYSAGIGSERLHGLAHDDTYIWAVCNFGGDILQINRTLPTDYDNITIGHTFSDDVACLNGYFYAGAETTPPIIYKIASDMSVEEITISGVEHTYGVFVFNSTIWACHYGVPGKIFKLTENLDIIRSITLPTDYNHANEIVFAEEYMFVTCWLIPARVVRYQTRFTFHGVFDETTGVLKSESERAVNVTSYFIEGVSSETFEVNGSLTFHIIPYPLYFHFDLGSNDREYWLSEDEGRNIYIFDATLTTYTISFLDLAGVLKSNPFVEAQRLINGTLMTVEKRKVDIENKIQFSLVQGRTYNIIIQNGESYTFGDLLMTSTTSVQLTIKGIVFTKETLMTYKYVRIYGIRVFGTPNGSITIIYQDTLNMTSSVAIYIKYKNGTNVYTATEYTGSFSHEWSNALNNTDYRVVCTITHGRYGVYSWKQYFPLHLSTMPWSLDWFGTSLPFNTAYIIPAILILFAGGCFSRINAEVGAFSMVIVAIIMAYMGWLPIPGSILVVAFTLAILMALIYAKRVVQT